MHLRGNKEKVGEDLRSIHVEWTQFVESIVEGTPSGASSTTQAIVYMVYIYPVKPQFKNPTLNFPAVSPGRLLTGLQRLGFFRDKNTVID